MSKFTDCLIAKGVSPEAAKRLARLTPEDAQTKIVKANDRLQQMALQAAAVNRINAILGRVKTPKERAKMFMDIISGSGARGKGVTSLERRIDSITASAHQEMSNMMFAFRPGKFGFSRNKKAQRDMVRAIFGQNITDNTAKAYADAWTRVTDRMLERFNDSAGGRGILNRRDFNIPQSHDPIKIGKTTEEEWIGFVLGKNKTGQPLIRTDYIIPLVSKEGKRLSPQEHDEIVRKVLKSVYEHKKTGGLKDITTKQLDPEMRRKIGNRHQEHRLLQFVDGDAWLTYSDAFGSQDYFNNMMNYINMMAREIGAIETFGPHADAAVANIARSIQSEERGVSTRTALNTYKEMMGQDIGVPTRYAKVFQDVRNITVAAKIGSAVIPATTDTFFVGLTSRFNGIPAIKTVIKGLAALAPGRHLKNAQTLSEVGLGAEYAINKAIGGYRYADVVGFGKSAFLADAVTRASGLNFWTEAQKVSFKLELNAAFTKLSGKGFKNLPRKLKASLQRYGIDSADWEQIRNATKHKGYIDIGSVDDIDVQAKWVGLINEETTFAVPEPTAKTRAILHQGTEKGTPLGEVTRFFTQFKSFSVSMLTGHFARGLNEQGASRLRYLGSLLAGTTTLGMAVIQTRDMINGKNPRTEITPRFVMDGLIQGGALGPLGDIFFEDPNAFGGVAQRLMGPAPSDAVNAVKIIYGTATDLTDDEREAADRIGPSIGWTKRMLPGGNLWYTKLAVQRYMFDALEKTLDPNWSKTQRRKSKRLKKETGQTMWSDPRRGTEKPKFEDFIPKEITF